MLASICISLYEVFGFPLRALFLFIFKNVRLSSEILPVMSIDAESLYIRELMCYFIMRSQIKRTPNSFIIEHKEILIVLQVMNQFNHDVFFRMSERAVRSILTLLNIIGIICAELGFIGFALIRINLELRYPVELFNSIVGFHANISNGTQLTCFCCGAHLP
jgi:hypothetical protein